MFPVYVPVTPSQQPVLYHEVAATRCAVQETGYRAVLSPKLREIRARFASPALIRTI